MLCSVVEWGVVPCGAVTCCEENLLLSSDVEWSEVTLRAVACRVVT